jgi:hypothetical protein
MVARATLAFALVSSLALGSACGESAPSYSATGKEQSCEEQCKVLHECDETVNTSGCQSDCADNEAISLQGQEVVTACLRERGCDASNPVQLVDCIDDGLGDLKPSLAGQAFCADTVDAFAECAQTILKDADRTDCLEGVSVLTDEVVSHLTDCSTSKETCEAKQLCALVILSDLNPSGALGDTGEALTRLLAGLLKSGTGSPP